MNILIQVENLRIKMFIDSDHTSAGSDFWPVDKDLKRLSELERISEATIIEVRKSDLLDTMDFMSFESDYPNEKEMIQLLSDIDPPS